MKVPDAWHPYPEAPDISDVLKKARDNMAGMMLTATFGGGIDAQPAMGLFRNLLRLTIRACEEYEAAVAAIYSANSDKAPHYIIYSASHWEACVEALYRAIQIAEVFRRQLGVWAPEPTHLRIEKSARFTDQEIAPIREMRHSLQHLDEDIAKYQPQPGHDPKGTGLFIRPDETAIHYHGIAIEYEQIANYLRRLGALCTWLHMQEIPAGHPLAHPERTSSVRVEDKGPFQKPFA